MTKRKKTKYVQGIYRPKNKHKYAGNVNEIIYRSSYELQFMNICDNNPAILEWASEEFVIPYIKPTDNKTHRYFLDFWIKYRSDDVERKPDYWEKVDKNKYSDKQRIQIELIIENKHNIITPIRNIVRVPNDEIGNVDDMYVCTVTNELFIKKQGDIIMTEHNVPLKKIKTAIIEIKPEIQTIPPKKPQRITDNYKKKCITYAINVAKWDAAKLVAEKNGMEFQIITEKWLKL